LPTDQGAIIAWLVMVVLISTLRARLDFYRCINKKIVNSRV